MFGNRLGWTISALLVMVVFQPLWNASRPPVPSRVSGAFPQLLSRVALPQDPRAAVPGLMEQNCDAGEIYRRAIDEHDANARAYEKYFRTPRSAQAEKPKAVELLTEATKCA